MKHANLFALVAALGLAQQGPVYGMYYAKKQNNNKLSLVIACGVGVIIFGRCGLALYRDYCGDGYILKLRKAYRDIQAEFRNLLDESLSETVLKDRILVKYRPVANERGVVVNQENYQLYNACIKQVQKSYRTLLNVENDALYWRPGLVQLYFSNKSAHLRSQLSQLELVVKDFPGYRDDLQVRAVEAQERQAGAAEGLARTRELELKLSGIKRDVAGLVSQINNPPPFDQGEGQVLVGPNLQSWHYTLCRLVANIQAKLTPDESD